ncbi:tyrosine-type recombinase/integrase [Citreimonas salinaria]|uniref:Integrase n=1 Tax=Citreimonas salinaria TaxID=321339 RepID=A0A1H3IQD1_9RHOB|nr:site-specific integrase [Citreimonas salinaria]SDY29986.1 Integrase [Citreimonas salinaria]
MPKSRGGHPDKALTAVKVRQLKEPGRYADGNGLHLVIEKGGSKRWLLRIMVRGRRRDMGLGSAALVSLVEARELALRYRKIAREGGDPIEERRQAQTVVPTFTEAVRRVHEESRPSWKNAKHTQQWVNTLESYAVPVIGDRPVNAVETADILRVLSPIWLTKAETARRVRQRMATVFDWAKAAGFRTGENPVSGVDRGLPKQTAKVTHHKAMPYQQVPQFITQLRSKDSGYTTRLALEFLILTAARTSEVLHATWSELDLEAGVWTVPAERMKAKREHRVPLTDRGSAILRKLQEQGTEGVVFPGQKVERPMSNMAMTNLLRRMEVDVTVHGFRSAFRDWVAEETQFPNELAEMALAHSIKNATEAAYRRGDLLERRREMMVQWEAFICDA